MVSLNTQKTTLTTHELIGQIRIKIKNEICQNVLNENGI